MNYRTLLRHKTLDKNYFFNNLGLLFSAREEDLDSFKSRLFPIKNVDKILTRKPTPGPATEPEVATEPTKATTTKTKSKIFSLKLREKFLNEIKNDEKI